MERITIVAEIGSFTGYHLHTNEIVRALRNRGIHASIRALKSVEKFAPIPADIQAHIVNGPQPEEWEILISPPHRVPTPGKKTVYWTMWESTVLAGKFVENVNMAEAVIVPSQWCADSFKRSGVTKPIYVVPLGINPDIFHYKPVKNIVPTTFSAAGRTAHGRDRKGMDGVMRAFLAAFPYDKNVQLRLKCHPDCNVPDAKDSRVVVVRQQFSEAQVADFLAKSHCFVSAATAEGWGLWQHQAMAIGRPVIAAIYGGLTEFMSPENAYPVEFQEAPSSENFGGLWARPDLMTMIDQMRAVHADRAEAEMRGKMASATVKVFTWERSGDELLTVLSELGVVEKFRSVFYQPKLKRVDTSVSWRPHPMAQLRGDWDGEVFGFETAENEVVFNPSLTSSFWFARRSVSQAGDRKDSSIFAFRAPLYNEKITERIPVNLPGYTGDDFEDPRAIADDSGIALSYTRVPKDGYPCQELAFLDKDLNIKDVWHVDFGNNGASPRSSKGPEKNWIWFKHDGLWHMIHWLEPMTVVRVKDGKVDEVFNTNKFNPNWMHGVRHGGAHPTRIGDEFFGFCHSLLPWFGRDRSRYFISAYAFEAKPPFAMTRLARTPLLSSNDDTTNNPCSCVIAGGALLAGKTWRLAVGAKDDTCMRIEIPHADVLESMDVL